MHSLLVVNTQLLFTRVNYEYGRVCVNTQAAVEVSMAQLYTIWSTSPFQIPGCCRQRQNDYNYIIGLIHHLQYISLLSVVVKFFYFVLCQIFVKSMRHMHVSLQCYS